MDSLLFNILFVAVGAVVGAIGGWCIRGSAPQLSDEPLLNPQPARTEPPAPVKPAEPDKGIEHVESLMSRLHQLTASVAADVDEHNNRVQAINNELVSGGDVVSIVERLVQANEQMQSQLQAAEQRLQTQASEIESHVKEARTDALTKLANRRAFDDELRRCSEEFRSKGRPSCVMMIDVDHFKKFNDTYGHQAGDEVLKGVARVLRRELAGKEIVCRYGGEEFAVIFPGMGLQEVLPRAEKGRAALAHEVFEFQGKDLKVTASGGIAQLQSGESGEQLVKRADDSLYVCKENGRNCGYWHDGQTSHPMKESSATSETPPTKTEAAAAEEPAPTAPREEKTVFKLTSDAEESKFDCRDRIAGLSDRETFCKDLERRLAEQQRTGFRASVVLVEMDRFAGIVEEFGEKAAELALRAAAQIVKGAMRDMDHVARFDDAVFAMLLPGASLADAGAVAERMRVAIENCKVPANGDHLRFTISLGASETQPSDTQNTVLARARQALNAALAAGGNCSLALAGSGAESPMALAT